MAADIAKAPEKSRKSPGFRDVHSEIRLLEQCDYGPPLRRAFGAGEVRQIIAEARSTVWPRLNEASVRLVSPKEFTQLWKNVGVQFQLAKLDGAEGLALMGFYVRKMGASKLPLICVNTAHHPAAIGAAFSHEMGHHLVGRLFDSHKDHARYLTYTAYAEHLDEPEELAADILVSLGVFPAPIARKMFAPSGQKTPPKDPPGGMSAAIPDSMLKYFELSYGLNFREPLPSGKKLQYLAALIHFAKLRRALLTEYGI